MFLTLLILIGIPAWMVSLWLWPWKPCGWCSGSGTNIGSNSRRHGNCRRCKGAKRVQRLGSKQMHRMVQSAKGRKK